MGVFDSQQRSLLGFKMSGLDQLLSDEEVRAIVRTTKDKKPDYQGTGGIDTYNLSSLELSPELRESISAKIEKVRELNDPNSRENMSFLRKIAGYFRS